MKSAKDYLSRAWGKLRSPKVDDQNLQERLERLRREMPAPVFWMLGKTQSGKTSIIRALTGSSRAEIGSGFRPCTRTSHLYPFPDENQSFLQFLDTRGLGEVHYDPSEDIRVMESQSHCLIVCLKAMDHAQQAVLEPLKKILKAHPRWPLIVVQTSLHEGYPTADTPHILPYPYSQFPFPAQVPFDLARSLASQRQCLEAYDARFVAVDFTQPEDDYYPQHYGLDALWTALEETVPLGLRAMMHEHRKTFRDAHFRAAHPHILGYAAAAGAAAGVPVPMIDIPLLLGIQAKLFHSIASIYDQELTAQRAAEVFGALGLGIAARMGGRELLKLVPGVGSAVSALFAAASTYALGCTLCAYFSYALEGDVPDAATLRRLYEKEYEEGRSRLRDYLQHASGQKPSP
ncbi:MAG: DUF697 domain-containing protein [Rhodopirellula sp.]|nr:DUF697 domain-containing protein [Rhodopirellula sp.]